MALHDLALLLCVLKRCNTVKFVLTVVHECATCFYKQIHRDSKLGFCHCHHVPISPMLILNMRNFAFLLLKVERIGNNIS